MSHSGWLSLALLVVLSATAQAADTRSIQLGFDLYAGGVDVANVDVGVALGPASYRITVASRTRGLAGLLYSGHQLDEAEGVFRDGRAEPAGFLGNGVWRGTERMSRIEYGPGPAVVRALVPPPEPDREPVPQALRVRSMDMLSALAQMIHAVERTGRCESSARLFDGRRASEITARTGQEEVLPATSRSRFYGPALRCDFGSRPLAGFEFTDGRTADMKPLRGSVWLAPIVSGAPPLPVRVAIETRFFGDATLFLTRTSAADEARIAGR